MNEPTNPYLNPSHKGKLKDIKILDFYSKFDLEKINTALKNKPATHWEKQGQKMALNLFKEASSRVPAYKAFLKKNKINSSKIKNIVEFQKIPPIDKDNYLLKYPLEKLCWDGQIKNNSLFSASSGSSGVPFFWPRGDNLEIETSVTHALFLKYILNADKKSTLLINSFSMGIYIAGVITLNSVLRSSQKELPVSIITPGIEIKDVLRIIKDLGNKYDQIILCGYPPFIKDILDLGTEEKIVWKKYNIKFLFATESFSENFREYVLKKVGSKNILHDSLNIYGSADAGILGHETPLSISIRRLAMKNRKIYSNLWPESSFVPAFVQYNPSYKYFEQSNEEVLFTGYGGIPLIRYNIHDSARLTSFNELKSLIDLKTYSKLRKTLKSSWKLPFVSIFGKSDLTISFYGLNIYPENIKLGLENNKISNSLTGRFVMRKKVYKNMEQSWEIFIELKKDKHKNSELEKEVSSLIMKSLLMHNLEFKKLHNVLKIKAKPKIHLTEYKNKKYFDIKSPKQKWTQN